MFKAAFQSRFLIFGSFSGPQCEQRRKSRFSTMRPSTVLKILSNLAWHLWHLAVVLCSQTFITPPSIFFALKAFFTARNSVLVGTDVSVPRPWLGKLPSPYPIIKGLPSGEVTRRDAVLSTARCRHPYASNALRRRSSFSKNSRCKILWYLQLFPKNNATAYASTLF